MIQIDDTIISRDIVQQNFICDLSKCKGICCVEGEEGAPVTEEEAKQIEVLLPSIWADLSVAAKEVIEKQGITYLDRDNDLSISIVNGAECVFAFQDAEGYWKCRIEEAFEKGKTSFKKPISCHLYPVRLQKHRTFTAVNYHQWHICKGGIELGDQENRKLFQFLKEPLIRRFGEDWYQQLIAVANYITNTEFKM
ncbi:DUF3109 family protein [Microbacter margulisiae]|uniref:DUF3109 family protein n=1 Tax=Microbacter margulisiae TaxID=1350067 RepID=A0A7W5H0E0_9PORP|nr:DUF3109 family protein [Microbacter margulisiae]MBB3186453.1 hypothetical protein [Microbacter margulisiae]